MVLPGLPQGGRELLSKGPLAPLLCAPCRAGLASLSKAGPIRLEAAMCQLVFRLWLCAQSAPPPQLPKSTHPPLYPLLRAFWVAALHTQRQRPRSQQPRALAVGGGVGADSLGPLPGADGAAPTPLGAGTESGPTVGKKGNAALLCLTRDR